MSPLRSMTRPGAIAVAAAAALWASGAVAAPAKPSPKPSAAPAKAPAPKPSPSPAPAWYGPQPETPAGGYSTPKPKPPSPPPEPKVTVREIVVLGNRRISDDRILLTIPIAVGDRVGKTAVYDAIQRLYGMGYFQDVKAGSEPVLGGERLVFQVVENPTMEDVSFEGVTQVPVAELAALFAAQKGDVINYNLLKEAIEKIQKRYADAGHPLARVADMNVLPGGIVHFAIAEGRIHAIKVEGNEETKEYVILRELTSKPGEIFNAETMRQDLRRLYNLNYFEDVNLKFEPAPDPSEVTVVIAVKEKQTGSINLGAGYSTTQGILGMLSVKKDNLLGTGQQVGVDFSISQQLQLTGELNYYNPWIAEGRTGFSANAYMRRFNNFLARSSADASGFREDRLGVSSTVSKPLFGDPLKTPWRGTVGARLEHVNTYQNVFAGGLLKPTFADGKPITNNQNTRPVDPNDASRNTPGAFLDLDVGDVIAAATLGATYDTRDIIMNPTEGQFHQLTLEPGVINGATPLVRGTGAFNFFYPLPSLPWAPTEHTTLALGTRFGSLLGPQVPAYERFYATGPYLIRGWPEFGSIFGGGSTTGMPLNYFQGSNAAVASLEYRFPIFNMLSGAFFGDTGLIFDSSLYDPNGNLLLHSGYGAGIRLNTPMGPIRLDYGFRSLTEGQFHFGIGNRF